MPEMTLVQTLLITLIQVVLAIVFIFVIVPMTIFAERKVLGFVQQRLGSTRIAGKLNGITGFSNRWMWGMGRFPIIHYFRGLPGLAGDILKLFIKEDIKLAKADRFVFMVSPCISMVAAMMVYCFISFYPGALFHIPGWVPWIGGLPVAGAIADVNVAVLMLLGVASVGVYGIVLGAWASNSKYPLLGGLRSAAQMVSYEVPLTLSLLTPVILAGSLNFNEMTRGAALGVSPLAAVPLFIGFFIYMTCGYAETNRLPFDMPEAENELVAGYHTEYSGMRFGLYYLAEYINMSVVTALATAFFFGGPWLLPFGLQSFIPEAWFWIGQPHWYVFAGKMVFFLFVYIWVRGSWPRYRYDQIMAVAWKYLLPLALVNLVLAGLVRYFA
jgi:NADH-quinone oxidoreductase subunit H